MEDTIINQRMQEKYYSMKEKLGNKQVLVPCMRGREIIRWKLRNIRRLRLSEISNLIEHGGDQITEEKRAKLIAREERLRQIYPSN